MLDQLDLILAESPEHARARERRVGDELEASPAMPVVLFGAGGLGRRTLALLHAHGRDVAAFVDNDPARWGTAVDGVQVLSPDDGSARFARDGLVVVTIWRAEGGHDFLHTRADLVARGWTRVESFISLFWSLGAPALPYLTIDLPSKVLSARSDVLAAAQLWADDRSLRDYVDLVRWRVSGDFAALPRVEPDQYFARGVVRLGPDEVFADCGAFTGDTLVDASRHVASWRAYHAFEPDPRSISSLEATIASLPPAMAERVRIHPAAISDHPHVAHFSATGLGSASLSSNGTFEVQCVAIDDVLANEPPTFIKMDIEGAESAALSGARESIETGPILAIAAYHKQADLWELPLQVHEMAPTFPMYLRPHVAEGFDTVLYAMPQQRVPAGR